jgi:hypothetical protein
LIAGLSYYKQTYNMIKVKILNQFVIREKDIEYLDTLPANVPGAAYTKEQKRQIDAIYTKYITKNGVVKSPGMEIYHLERKRGWSNGEKMTAEAAQRIILEEVLIEILKEPIVAPDRLAQIYKQAIMLDEAHRILYFHVYDFK